MKKYYNSRSIDLPTSFLVYLSDFIGRFRSPDLSRYADDFAYSKWQMANAMQDYETFYESLNAFAERTVLDLGCGDGGKTVYYSSKRPKIIVGMDVDPEKVCRARQFSFHTRVENHCCFLTGDVTHCPFPSNSFDTVLSEDCFEHYPNPEAVLHEAFRLVRPGGLFIASFITYYASGGPHLYNFIRLPWPHLFFSDQTMIKATRIIARQMEEKYPKEQRRETFTAQAEREIFQFQHFINKITLARWRRLIKKQRGWRILIDNAHCKSAKSPIFRLPVFKLPVLEELHNDVLYVLQKR